MKKATSRILWIVIAAVLSGFYPGLYAEDAAQPAEKTLDLTAVFRTSYALGGDTAGVKEKEEAIYFAQGDTYKALAILKNTLIEHKPLRFLDTSEQIDIIIFRGVLSNLGKIELIKAVSKGNSFEVYAKYIDIPGADIPSQPAVIIPVGKLPKGKYSAALYVEDQLHKKVNFTVRRAPFTIDLHKK